MSWFRPKTLLDSTYEIGILIKGIDGLAELAGGLLVLFIRPSFIESIVTHATNSHFVVHHPQFWFIIEPMLRYGGELAHGHNGFAVAFLLSHGAIKIILVAALLRNLPWAYPFALITLGLFTLYQFYLIAVHVTLGMTLLTLLDLFIIWLIWREWQKFKVAGQTSEA